MEWLVFLALVGLVGVGGVAAGLALAPRLAAWDDARARRRDDGRTDDDPADGSEGAEGADGGGDDGDGG